MKCTTIPGLSKLFRLCRNQSNPHVETIEVQDDRCLINGEYWGNITERTDNSLKIEGRNGQIFTIIFKTNKHDKTST